MILTAFHWFVVFHHTYAEFRLLFVQYGDTQLEYLLVMRNMSFRYLTVWNLILQSTYFTGCAIEDVLGRKLPLMGLWKQLRERIFQALVFPAALLVTSTFWVLFLYDRDLVYPSFVDEYVPPHANHMMHTSITLFAVLELLLRPHHYSNRKWNIRVLLFFCISYLAVFMWTYFQLGIWIYPLFYHLNWAWRMIVIVVLTFVSPVLWYHLGEKAALNVWGNGKSYKTNGEKR